MRLTILMILFLGTLNSFGQRVDSAGAKIPRCYWVEVAPGISSLGSIAVMLGANAELGNKWLASAIYMGETNELLDFGATRTEDINTLGLLAGKLYKKNNTCLALSAGVALVNVDIVESNSGILGYGRKEKKQNTIGVPIVARAYFVALQTFGLGLGAYANLNTIQTTAGLTLNVGIGRLSTHRKK